MQNKQPTIIVIFLPNWSAIQPLIGLAINALPANAGIIQPIYSLPPNSRRSAGNSGIIRLNERKKSRAPAHKRKKAGGKGLIIFTSEVLCHQRHDSTFSEGFRANSQDRWRLITLIFVFVDQINYSVNRIRVVTLHDDLFFPFVLL